MPAQQPESHNEQNGIQREIDILSLNARSPIDDRSNARDAAHCDLVGQEEELPSHCT